VGDHSIGDRFCDVRTRTEALAAPLSGEDQTVQSMPDVSPTKWHRAHTTWFFETFVLADTAYATPYDPSFDYLFNSYYESVGPRFERVRRGMLSRPGAKEVGKYRVDVDARMCSLLATDLDEPTTALVTLGLNHEQQHQELLVMDAKHVLSQHPTPAAYATRDGADAHERAHVPETIAIEGGLVEVGASGEGFCFDNETPRHRTYLEPCALSGGLVSCGSYLEFMEDGGYDRPELWLSEGWSTMGSAGWRAPLYWTRHDGTWHRFTLFGLEELRADDPVCHVSYFEADAFARWSGARLPTEFEWEVACGDRASDAPFLLEPPAVTAGPAFYGSVWQWTQSAYAPYPGFRAAPGAVGEYNGKFMVNQQVLRGSASITPPTHPRATYRNFYGAPSRWPYTGIRLAWDGS
jgi:ergothioneine biosynthesis protein EgtB